MTTEELLNICREFCMVDPSAKGMSAFLRDTLIKRAIIDTDRETRTFDQFSPLAWDIVSYSGLQTIGGADIASITQASPGVVDADQKDTSIDGHGFDDDSTIQDIVVIDGIEGMTELNKRYFLVVYVDADTFTLKSLDGLTAINTTSLTEYSSSGSVYHAGFVLNTTTILTDVDSKWTFKRLLPSPMFDGYPTKPITENEIRNSNAWTNVSNAGRPSRYRYWQQMTAANTYTHYLMWYPVANSVYNLDFQYQKQISDIAAWTSSTYPFHPEQIHDTLWHGALAKLCGFEGIKVLNANRWMAEYAKDKVKVINYSRELLGAHGGGGISG